MAVGLNVLTYAIQGEVITRSSLLRSLIIPILIAPTISWYLIGLLFRLHQLEERMAKLATYDDLTGLLNRRVFLQSFNAHLKLAARKNLNISLMLIDIDHFKTINDSYGHSVGDQVLSSIGKLLRNNSRQSDVIGRVGGEEFAILLPATNLNEAKTYAEKCLKLIAHDTIDLQKTKLNYHVSIGLADYETGMSLSQLYKAADKALYQAKNNGRNRIEYYATLEPQTVS